MNNTNIKKHWYNTQLGKIDKSTNNKLLCDGKKYDNIFWQL